MIPVLRGNFPATLERPCAGLQGNLGWLMASLNPDFTRRAFMALSAASAALAACETPKMDKPLHVGVIGGGIIDASIA